MQSYRSLYLRLLAKPVWSALPGCAEWKLSAVLSVCRKELKVEVRQPPAVWALVQAQHVPFRLKEFVVAALWSKLPVVQRLRNFQVLDSVDCLLFGVLKDHPPGGGGATPRVLGRQLPLPPPPPQGPSANS